MSEKSFHRRRAGRAAIDRAGFPYSALPILTDRLTIGSNLAKQVHWIQSGN